MFPTAQDMSIMKTPQQSGFEYTQKRLASTTNQYLIDSNYRERTARSSNGFILTIAADTAVPIVQEDDHNLRVFVRNLDNNPLYLLKSSNGGKETAIEVVFGMAGAAPVAGEQSVLKVSHGIWAFCPGHTCMIQVRIEKSR